MSEDPSKWEQRANKSEVDFMQMYVSLEAEKNAGRHPPLLEYVTLKDSIELKYLEGLSVMNQRVPALEMRYKDK